jgi:TPR repeat protein
VTAQYNLGVCYENGIGVTQDYAKAVNWYREAAEQGDIHAQYQLGVCINERERSPKGQVLAYKWLSLASAQGHGRAQKQLKNIETKMTKKQITEALRLVCEFKRKHSKSHRMNRLDLRGLFSWQASLLTAKRL